MAARIPVVALLLALALAEEHVLKPSPTHDPTHVDRILKIQRLQSDGEHTLQPQSTRDPSHAERDQLLQTEPRPGNEGQDMLFTEEQLRLKAERKAHASLSYRWTEVNGFPEAPFAFKDDLVNQTAVRKAVEHWTSNTCIKMPEVASTYTSQHIYFQRHASACNSFVGMVSSSGQAINVPEWCEQSFGSLVHEIGHAMGMYHEQSRSDRDDYVTIITANLQSGSEGNFDKENDNNYGVPYDYSSDMHYFSTAFTKNSGYTIIPKDLKYIDAIGQRSGLSHMDKLLANRMYGCDQKWLTSCSLSTDPCQNNGYTGSDCNCVCPPGTSGTNCETVTQTYPEQILGCSESFFAEGTVTSPGHPSAYGYDDCIKYIQAPTCKKVQLTFTAFNMYPNNTSNNDCRIEYLDIWTDWATGIVTKTRYCGTLIAPNTVFTSTNNDIAIIHNSATNWLTGWSANIVFIDDPTCATQAPTTQPPAPTTQPPAPTTQPPAPTTQPPAPTTQEPITQTTNLPSCMDGTCNDGCGIQIDRNDSVWVSSPNYPGQYPNNVRCQCNDFMRCSEPGRVLLTLHKFSLNKKDKVTILSPYLPPKKLTKTKSSGARIILPSTALQFSFFTNKWGQGDGFMTSFTSLPYDCYEELDASAPGTSTTPDYPSRHSGVYCEYIIRATPGKRVEVSFTALTLGSRRNRNRVYINRSTGPFYARSNVVLSRNTPRTVQSEGETLRIYYEGRKFSGGFTFDYKEV